MAIQLKLEQKKKLVMANEAVKLIMLEVKKELMKRKKVSDYELVNIISRSFTKLAA